MLVYSRSLVRFISPLMEAGVFSLKLDKLLYPLLCLFYNAKRQPEGCLLLYYSVYLTGIIM